MLRSELSKGEVQSLATFRFIEKKPKESTFIHYTSLMQPAKVKEILYLVQDKMGTPNFRVAASMLTKRMAFYAVIHLYAMTALGKRLCINPEHVQLIENDSSSLWLPDFYFEEMKVEEVGEDRSQAREEMMQHVFRNMLTPVVQLLSRQVKLPERVMWENIVHYIFWLYEDILQTAQAAELKKRAREDFYYIIHKAHGNLFGSYERNPLTPFDRDLVFNEALNEPVRIRKTCCLAYLLDENEEKMCTTCPIPVHRKRE